MPTVNQFRAAVQRRGGVQRQYRWRVIVNFPAFAADNELARDASLTAITTQTPPSTLGEILIPWGGRELPYPGDRKFEALPITFIGVGDDSVHSAWEKWSEGINGSSSNQAGYEPSEYMRDIQIQLLDDRDVVKKTYTLEAAWPQNVGELELDQTAQDSYAQFTATLRFLQATNDNSL
ncbi:tail tube protein [Vibrio phage VP-1]|uniref:Tail tube protein n=1 Tax=Vibrio phage VP-1 TaxID=2234088 RepID=A0A4P2TEC5_9CAUD|nr:tail tube protein [Vibrio phage VP-1]